MARISFSALVEEITGKLAGSVFKDSYGGMQIRTRVSPRNPQTNYQQLRRGEFGFISAGWRTLTSVQRQTFIDAALTPPGGMNLYVQSNINLTLINEPLITSYVPSSDPGSMAIAFTAVEAESDVTLCPPKCGKMIIKATGGTTVVPAGTKLLLQVTFQKEPQQIFTNPSMYSPVLSFDEGTDLAIQTDIIDEWRSRYGILSINKRLCLKANLIDKSNGLRGADMISCTISEEMAKFVKIFSSATPVVSSGTAITDAFSAAIAANTLTQVGDTLTMIYQGKASALATTPTLRWTFAGTTYLTSIGSTAADWTIRITMIYKSSTEASLSIEANYGAGTDDMIVDVVTGLNWTTSQTALLKIQAPTAGSVTAEAFYINKELV